MTSTAHLDYTSSPFGPVISGATARDHRYRRIRVPARRRSHRLRALPSASRRLRRHYSAGQRHDHHCPPDLSAIAVRHGASPSDVRQEHTSFSPPSAKSACRSPSYSREDLAGRPSMLPNRISNARRAALASPHWRSSLVSIFHRAGPIDHVSIGEHAGLTPGPSPGLPTCTLGARGTAFPPWPQNRGRPHSGGSRQGVWMAWPMRRNGVPGGLLDAEPSGIQSNIDQPACLHERRRPIHPLVSPCQPSRDRVRRYYDSPS